VILREANAKRKQRGCYTLGFQARTQCVGSEVVCGGKTVELFLALSQTRCLIWPTNRSHEIQTIHGERQSRKF